MSTKRVCDSCHKLLANRHSLSRHRKICKGVEVSPLKNSNPSFDEPAVKRVKVHKLIETVDDEVSVNTSEDEKSEDSIDECEDEEELYDEILWEILCVKCFKNDWSIYECMHKHLDLYYNIEKDDPYQEIMEDVEKEESQGTCFVDALDSAIKKHEDLIEESAAEYRDNTLYWRNEPPNVWRYLSIPCKYRCSGHSATECNCENRSCSNLRRFRALALTLHAMENDDLIQDIIEAVKERTDVISIEDAIDRELKVREGSIVAKFKEAKERLEKKSYDTKSLLDIFKMKMKL